MVYSLITIVLLAFAFVFVSIAFIKPKTKPTWLLTLTLLLAAVWALQMFFLPAGGIFYSLAVFFAVLLVSVFAGEMVDIYVQANGNRYLSRGVSFISINSISLALIVGLIILIGLQYYSQTKVPYAH